MNRELELLSKIRTQINSGLENQKKAAVLLTAIEESIQEQGEQLIPMAYFGTIMTIIDQSFEGDNSIIPAAVYILSVVFPRYFITHSSISSNILRLKFADITSIFQKIISTFNEDAPTVRGVINCYEYLLFAQENNVWNSDSSCRQSFQFLLGYSVDQRPKVRKRAADAIKRILSNPPPPSLAHPGTVIAIDFYFNVIENFHIDKTSNKSALESQVTDALVNLKLLIPTFAMQSNNDKIRTKFEKLCSALLKLPSRTAQGQNVLTQWSFEVFSSLLSPENTNDVEFKVLYTLTKAMLELSPYENDAVLTPLWLTVITFCFARLSEVVCDFEIGKIDRSEEHIQKFSSVEYPKLVSTLFQKMFKTVFDTNLKIKPAIVEKAVLLLSSLFDTCVSDGMIKSYSEGCELAVMLELVDGSLNNIRYRDHWGNILSICAAIFKRLATEYPVLVAQLLEKVFIIRDDKGYSSNFPYKVEMDHFLEIAIQNLGMQIFLAHVPMNIENEYPGQPRRPYILALLCKALETAHSTSEWHVYKVYGTHSLKYYLDELLPLADRLLKKSGDLWDENRQLEAKLFETLGLQIWSMFPSLCATLPEDTAAIFGHLAKRLGKVLTILPKDLYPNLPSKPDLRPTVCQGLENLVESFYLFANLNPEQGDDQDKLHWKELCGNIGREVISKVQKYVNRFLSAICNIYTSVDLEDLERNKHRGQTLQSIHEKTIQTLEKTIKKLLLIAEPSSISEYFTTMTKSVSQMLANPNASDIDRLTLYTIFDLVLILIPALPKEQYLSTMMEFYKICLEQLKAADSTLQKKSYKCLSAILSLMPMDSLKIAELAELLMAEEVITRISPGSIRPRMKLLQQYVELVNENAIILQFIPTSLPEVMLATKESNEKTRDSAYDCLIAMCKKMMSGNGPASSGLDRALNSLGLEDGSAHTPEVSIKEFSIMVMAGLGGSSSHMQSAAIASLGRLFFEFSSMMDVQLILELLKTVIMCMSFKNREVTKAALGFIKVAIVSLPEDITSILEHTREHKSHFKSKARHIFERLIRKFSYETIEQYFPEQDKKLIANIKKRRDALKKRKSQSGNEDIAEQGEKDEKKKSKGGSQAKSFEKAFHDSGSELESDEDDYIPDQFKDELTNKKQIKTETLIHEGDIDFLDNNVVSKLSQSKARKTKKNFAGKTNEDGRLIFGDSEEEREIAQPEISEDYYKQSLASEVAFTRTADGRVKFVKRKRMEEDNGEIEETKDVGQRWNAGKKKTKAEQTNVESMLGRQYKAKKARGDVKKPGMADPHSYIPLSGKIVGNMNKSTKIDGNLKNILKAAVKGTDAGIKSRKNTNVKVADLQLKPIPSPAKTHNHLVCNMTLSGFMPDHVDFVSYFARNLAHQYSMPTSEVIHLPTKIKKWTVMKGPFVHAKSKQVFERKTHKRLIQVFDSHPESLKEWISYVNENLPAGIDMETEKFERKSLSYVDTLPDAPTDSYEARVKENDGKVLAVWEFKTLSNSKDNHYNLLSKSIGDVFKVFEVQELHLTFTRGRWMYDRWGYHPNAVPSGVELWSWINSENVNDKWTGLTNALAGLFCSSLNFMDESLTSEPVHAFQPSMEFDQPTKLRYASLPREIVCTENLTPWAKLLPCQTKAGLASLLNGYKLFDDSPFNLQANWVNPEVSFLNPQLANVRLHRHLGGSGQERGFIVVDIYNDDSERKEITYLETIPWILKMYLHTFNANTKTIDGAHSTNITKMTYSPAIDRQRPTMYEILLELPPNSKTTLTIDFDCAFIKVMEHYPDANYGFEIGTGVGNVDGRRIYSDTILIRLPTPDFSMPYNVITLTCTVLSLFFGSIFNMLTRRYTPIVNEKYKK
ncbi:hypothetical protein HDV01_007225 [Terramyces sp. JEL0728]|nr:hypothetical protein HDV01_007225 [Terramyces sp. JEL0728]